MSDWLRWRRPDARPDVERDYTDARAVAEHVRLRTEDPEIQRRVKLRRRASVLGLGAICLAGSVVAFFGEGGYLDMRRLHTEIAALDSDIERRRADIRRLENDVQALGQDPMARERVAREQLGLVRPGEIDFLLPRERPEVWESAAAATGSSGSRP